MSTERIELGPFTLEVGEFRLARDGAPVALQPKALELLIALVRAGGDLRTRDQLRTALWPDVVVTEQSLRQVVMRLREALGPAHEAWVQTVPRKGLRFDGPIARAPVVASPSLGSVPAERDALIGRAAELELLTAAVEAGRLVSILGPGGIGKTRLAAHLARSWPTGAWFCALADARTLDGVVAAVAATLGVALDGADPLERLGYAIAARGPCLIVLDNAEQVVDEIRAALHRWLDRAAEARFVVTTRRRLGVPGERLIALDPLTQPAAEQLFRVRAAAVRPGLPDDGAVAALVGLVDRLPLAIELAAARVGVLTPAAIRDRLSQRFELLREEGRPARQQSLTAVLDWSWELLAPAEQDAAVALAVFEGGASLEAAEARIGLERLQALVDQCWVRSVGGRFEMLSTLQAYARDRSTDLQGAEAAHGRSFAARIEQTSPWERGRVLAPELDNLAAASARAAGRGDGGTAGVTALGAWDVLEVRGPYAEGIRLLEGARSVPGAPDVAIATTLSRAFAAAGRSAEAREAVEWALARASDPTERAVALLERAVLDREAGRADLARVGFEEALASFRARGESWLEARTALQLGWCEHGRGAHEAARTWYASALALARRVGDLRVEGLARSRLASLCLVQGPLADVEAHCEAALTVERAGGYAADEARTRTVLGIARSMQGRLDEAEDAFRTALAQYRALGNRHGEATALGHLGTVHGHRGQLDASCALFAEAVALHRALGSPSYVALFLGNLGTTTLFRGATADARAALEEALAIDRQLDQAVPIGFVQTRLGDLHALAGEPEQARAAWIEARDVLRDARAPAQLALCLIRLAEADRDDALADEAATLGAPFPEVAAEVLAERAVQRARAGRFAEARADARRAVGCGQIGMTGAAVAAARALVSALTGDPGAAAAIAAAEQLLASMEVLPSAEVARRVAEAGRLVASRR